MLHLSLILSTASPLGVVVLVFAGGIGAGLGLSAALSTSRRVELHKLRRLLHRVRRKRRRRHLARSHARNYTPDGLNRQYVKRCLWLAWTCDKRGPNWTAGQDAKHN